MRRAELTCENLTDDTFSIACDPMLEKSGSWMNPPKAEFCDKCGKPLGEHYWSLFGETTHPECFSASTGPA